MLKATYATAALGMLPEIADEDRIFWDAAERGELLVEWCAACDLCIFPLRGICRNCRSRSLDAIRITGAGTVFSFTINWNEWFPGMEVPFVLAVVEFPDYPGLRVLGRVRASDPSVVVVGSEVEIGFERASHGMAVPSFVALEGAKP